MAKQTLLGVTGSGKTYTIANVIQAVQKPTLVMAPNKTLAAQLYGEFKAFFPHNAVEYFVSYYDYYQPEAYVPSSDTFIEKDSSINEHIEQMRLSATKALLSRRDTDRGGHGIGHLRPGRARGLPVAAPDPVARRAHRPARSDQAPDPAAVHAQRIRTASRHVPGEAAR